MSEDHKPMPVAGYTTQSQANIDAVNENKQMEELCLQSLDRLRERPEIDQRWLAIGRTSLEQAFMAINSAIFKPGRAKV
jgi:hypothetical protein